MVRLIFFMLLVGKQLDSVHRKPSEVLFDNPRCGGILISAQAILTTANCARPGVRLVLPHWAEPQGRAVIHADGLVAILFFKQRINGDIQPLYDGKIEDPIQPGSRIRFSNTERSVENSIDQIDRKYIQAFYGLPNHLEGSPMWLIRANTKVIGMMLEENKALRLDGYADFILQQIKKMSSEQAQEAVAIIPAEVMPNKDAVVFIEAQPEGSLPDEPNQLPETPNQQLKPPESLGCACSQIRHH